MPDRIGAGVRADDGVPMTMHPTLRRQLERCYPAAATPSGAATDALAGTLPDELRDLLRLVDERYRDADAERESITRSLEALEESEERYRLLMERSPEAISVYADGLITYVNDAAVALLGAADAAEVIGLPVVDFVHPESRDLLAATVAAVESDRQPRMTEYRILRRDGTQIEVELVSVPVRYNGRGAIQSVGRDVTIRRKAERAMRESEALLRVAEQRARTTADRMKTVADAAAKVIAADSDVALQMVLREACTAVLPLDSFSFALYDAARDVLCFLADPWERSSTVVMPVRGTRNEGVVRQRAAQIERGTGNVSPDELRAGVSRASRSAIRVPILAGTDLLGVLVVQSYVPDLYGSDDLEVVQALAALTATALRNIRLVEEIRRSEEKLAYQAYHDPLTDLANRARFQERVVHALQRTEREPDTVAVLFFDLDDFKTVNDSLGHQEGDRLLVAAAERLLNATRGSDTVARLGGDEFAVLLENVRNEADMRTVAGRINQALRSPFALEGTEVFVSASIGLARATAGTSADDLLRNADAAMYAAKSRGKGQYAIFETSMHAAIVERLELEADLRRAIVQAEFRLHYQPIVDLRTGAVMGMEALLRWEHHDRGMIQPNAFIPFAEETGLIVPIGRWVLREACRQAAEWRLRFPDLAELRITVNLSARQLREASLPTDVGAALADSGLPGDRLVLEITESVLMQDTEMVLLKLEALKRLGVSLAIDDFGTGYSSLAYLQRFPIDILKIDKTFVDAIGSPDVEPTLARAIIALGESLAMCTVAEGVENAEQVDELQRLGCHLGQGYLLSRPLPPLELAAFLTRHRSTPVVEGATPEESVSAPEALAGPLRARGVLV